MMRIAHLTTVDMSLRFLILPQLKAASEVGEALGISAPGPYVTEVEALGITHVPLPSSTRGVSLASDLKAMIELWRALRAMKIDILHTHNPKPGVYGRILGRLAGVPIVINTVHGLYATEQTPIVKRLFVYALEAIASRFSDLELIQNPEDFELLRRLKIVPQDKLRLLGNGVDLDRFNPIRAETLRKEARQRFGVSDGPPVVGMVGRLVAEKGISELIEAAETLTGEVRFVVAGPFDPEKSDALTDRLISRGRAAGVEFVGMVKDVESFYAAIDLFVLPSHREGFPRAAMEAAASGLPLVLTDIRGCRQVVDDGANGRLVPVGDAAELAAAIEEVMAAPDLQRMGEASAAKARESFDERSVVDIVMDSYYELAKRRGLSWKFPSDGPDAIVRPAMAEDLPSVARLHVQMIAGGFLSSLGSSFLELLYGALRTSDGGLLLVAESDGRVIGFIAGAADTSALYKFFLRRHFLAASLRLAPRLLRPSTWRRVWETLRYGTSDRSSVDAELLSMAVSPDFRRRGVGRKLVAGLMNHAKSAGIPAMSVVVGAGNVAAITLYKSTGFEEERRFQLHHGEESMELTWRS